MIDGIVITMSGFPVRDTSNMVSLKDFRGKPNTKGVVKIDPKVADKYGEDIYVAPETNALWEEFLAMRGNVDMDMVDRVILTWSNLLGGKKLVELVERTISIDSPGNRLRIEFLKAVSDAAVMGKYRQLHDFVLGFAPFEPSVLTQSSRVVPTVYEQRAEHVNLKELKKLDTARTITHILGCKPKLGNKGGVEMAILTLYGIFGQVS